MTFHEKLQQLRNDSKLTQEALAEKLFVSRVTVSKWETGRGYPNLDSLKAMAEIFGVSIDQLLSNDELFEAAQTNLKKNSANLRSIVFGLFDFLIMLFFFLPLFVDYTAHADKVVHLSLLNLNCSSAITKLFLEIFTGLLPLLGIVELALQNCEKKWLGILSIVFSVILILLYISTNQQNACILTFFFLIAKVVVLFKVTKRITNVN